MKLKGYLLEKTMSISQRTNNYKDLANHYTDKIGGGV